MCLLGPNCWHFLGATHFLGNTFPLVLMRCSGTVLLGEKDRLGDRNGNLSMLEIRKKKNSVWHLSVCPCFFFKESCPSVYISLFDFSLSEKQSPMQRYITGTRNRAGLQQNWCLPSLEQISPGPAEWLLHSCGKACAWQMCLNSLSTSGHC